MTKVLINQYSESPFPPDQKKDEQEIFKRGTATFPLQYYLNNTVASMYDLPVHWHIEFELLQVISGTYNAFVGGKTFSLNKGDVCLIPGKELHGDAPNKGEALYESVVFDIELIRHHGYASDDFINSIMSGVVILNNYISNENKEISCMVHDFFETVKNGLDGYELMTCGYLLLLLGAIKKNHLYVEKKTLPLCKRKLEEQINAVIALIRKDYSKDLTLEDFAKVANLSPKYFCRIFKEATDRSPIEYLNWYRINQACSKLRESKDKLSIIASECGFSDFSYFIKIFKRFKGITPLKYRNFEDKGNMSIII